jgi:hypothetical protein
VSLDNVEVFCVVCGTVVPLERKRRRSITCSDGCAKTRGAYLRARVEARKCKYCGVPASLEERAAFKAWRKSIRDAAKAKAVVK